MAELNSSLWWIPPIGSSNLWSNSTQGKVNVNKPDVAMFDNAPSDVTAWSFFWKILLWAVVWICAAILLLATLSAIWWLSDAGEGISPIIGLLLPVAGFVVGFVCNLALALLYNVFFSKRYYSFGKMAWLIFASSLIIFLFFIPLYFLYKGMYALYTLLWFQIILELFIAKNLIDFLSQPNYSASSLMGNTLWAVLALLVHILITSTMDEKSIDIKLIIVSSGVVYILMALWSWIWDAIYYKFYEWWNNPFYLPSLNELREERKREEIKKAKEEEEVNVEIK